MKKTSLGYSLTYDFKNKLLYSLGSIPPVTRFVKRPLSNYVWYSILIFLERPLLGSMYLIIKRYLEIFTRENHEAIQKN